MEIRNILTVGTLSLALAACGGGGGTADAGSGSADTSTSATPSMIKGIAASGLPMVGAIITVTDSTGTICLATEVTTDVNGYYEADTSKCVPPMLVHAKATQPDIVDGIKYEWESMSITNNAVINISPVTTVITASTKYNPSGLGWVDLNLKSTPAQLAQKLKDAQTALVAAMRQSNIDIPDNFDFVHSPFAADGSGIDAVLDAIKVTQDSATGTITVYDKTGTVPLLTVNAVTGVVSKAGSSAVWPDYLVFNSLTTGTPRELGTSSRALADDIASYKASTATTGTLSFKNGTHATINVTANYNPSGDGIAPLVGQSGNERLNAQVVAICTGGNVYAMLSKTATIVPLSELANGAAMKMEQLGVSESCPLNGSGSGPTSFQFSGNGGNVTTPNGTMTAAQFAAVNQNTTNSASGYDRLLAFKVSVNGQLRYGLIERGLDQGNGQAPFMLIHVQQ